MLALVSLPWGDGTPLLGLQRPLVESWSAAVRSASQTSTKSVGNKSLSQTAAASLQRETAGWCVHRSGFYGSVPLHLTCFVFVVLTRRTMGARESSSRNKVVDENCNNVSSPSRGGLAGKLQQLLTPTKHRASVRRAASVGDRRPGGGGGGGGGGIGRRVSDQRQSRKAQVAETLLKAKERLVNATSEVTT